MVSVEMLPIPKGKQTQLKNKGLNTTEDLLRMKPLHTYDFTVHTPIKDLVDGQVQAVSGVIKYKTRAPRYVRFTVEDDTGQVDVFIFGQMWLANKFDFGDKVTVGGKVKKDSMFVSFGSVELFEKGHIQTMVTRYSKVKGMSDDYLRNCIKLAEEYPLQETLDRDIRRKFGLIDVKKLSQSLHHPTSKEDTINAHKRLMFEELFIFDMKLFASRRRTSNKNIPPMNTFNKVKALQEQLPFDLTVDQNKVLKEIFNHFITGDRINTLVQGDVGSGKTMVALFSMLAAVESGHQGVMMAPTTVLAQQHYLEAVERLEPLGCKIIFVHGGMKAKEKRDAYKAISSGEADIIIGTHAAISKDVIYKSLRVVIIDEEHRFGVEQRERLEDKAQQGAHKISLTATPIPRTLANTLFGEDVKPFAIKSMPAGRKSVRTARGTTAQGFRVLEDEIKKGHQGYIVCPLIETNSDIKAKSVEQIYKDTKDYFKGSDTRIAMIHGKMKQNQIDEMIEDFVAHKYDILISTTIIEVGVNVGNATVMMIESADRFGLSQLHQLRGRVGRSSFQSYCLLTVGDTISEDAEKKIDVIVSTTDGFKIAEEDMKIRGTGNLVGVEQSGASSAIDIMLKYPEFSQSVKDEVIKILDDPFRLEHYRYMFDSDD